MLEGGRSISTGISWVVVLVAGMLVVVAVGCGEKEPEDTSGDEGCQLDRDCPVGDECTDGECVPIESGGCVDELDCDDGEECVMGECEAETMGADGGDASDANGADTMPGDTDAGDCAGCFASMGEEATVCVVGTHNEACGTGGGACTACATDEYCSEGSCEEATCTPDSCDGCCLDDECQDGDTDEACGTGAETCETCSGAAFCEDGECVAPCSETCDGCCDADGNCKEGNSSASCGSNGVMCQSCVEGEECRGGGCVEVDCQATCKGCCADGACKPGTEGMACGRDGDACQSCAGGFGCDERATGGVCVLQDDSRWDVVVVRGKVPNQRKVDGTFGGKSDEQWDDLSKPDVFVEVANGAASASEKTSVKKDDLEPSWEETTIANIRAADLRKSGETTLKIVDSDFVDNDLIAECGVDFEVAFGQGDFDGDPHEFVCNHTHAGEEIEPKVWLRLERH